MAFQVTAPIRPWCVVVENMVVVLRSPPVKRASRIVLNHSCVVIVVALLPTDCSDSGLGSAVNCDATVSVFAVGLVVR